MVDVLHQDFVKECQALDIFPYVQRATLDIILETAMGVCMDIQNKRHSEYLACIEDTVRIMQLRQALPWYMNDIMFKLFPIEKKLRNVLKVLKDFTKDVVNEKASRIQNISAEKNRTAFLDLLLSYKVEDQSLSLEDITEEVDTFMFEGHDTTTCSIAWTLFLIGNHPEV